MFLSTSQRVSLMKEVSQRLGGDTWAIIDLTLKQFGQPTSDMFGGETTTYVLSMIENSSDDTLIELAEHLGFRLDFPVGRAMEPPFWRKGMFRLFISHLSAHKKWAADLQEALLRYGISSFVAHNDIEPTHEWQVQIETALSTCDSLVALMHDGFHKSSWTDQEIGFAMGRGVPVFAVRFGETPYGFIGRFQAFNGNNTEPAELAEELFDGYRKNKQTKRTLAPALVMLFADSPSFAAAKARIGYLEELDVWEPSYSERILAASEANSQIVGSWGVVDRVHTLVQKRAKTQLPRPKQTAN